MDAKCTGWNTKSVTQMMLWVTTNPWKQKICWIQVVQIAKVGMFGSLYTYRF